MRSSIRVQDKNNNYHVWLNGTLDISTINEVKDRLSEILASKPDIVAVNFNEVDFIDSSGLAVFVSLLKSSMCKKTDFVFYELSADIHSIFKVASLDRFFNIITTEQFKKDYEKKVL